MGYEGLGCMEEKGAAGSHVALIVRAAVGLGELGSDPSPTPTRFRGRP